ncbi:MAG: hypothetical protein B6245_06800 [Desulfobacteraceae bacterium 4572_88]|nr:MAG: hypothetical protein B6245_06800 [Desulfobacteraceae bacterium 4572_88]
MTEKNLDHQAEGDIIKRAGKNGIWMRSLPVSCQSLSDYEARGDSDAAKPFAKGEGGDTERTLCQKQTGVRNL